MLWRIDITDIDHEFKRVGANVKVLVDLTIWFDGPAHPHAAPECFDPEKGLGSLWEGWEPGPQDPLLESVSCRVASQSMANDRRVRRVCVKVTQPGGWGGHDISIGLDVSRSDLDAVLGS